MKYKIAAVLGIFVSLLCHPEALAAIAVGLLVAGFYVICSDIVDILIEG